MFIATGDSKERKPVQVRAELPSCGEIPMLPYAWRGFETMVENCNTIPAEALGQRLQDCRAADLQRAIDAAEKCGLRCYRVETGADGTISIIVGNPARGASLA